MSVERRGARMKFCKSAQVLNRKKTPPMAGYRRYDSLALPGGSPYEAHQIAKICLIEVSGATWGTPICSPHQFASACLHLQVSFP